jgi:hypothetical protein
MAATKAQGKGFALFIVGAVVTTAGIAYISSGSGLLALIVGLIVLAVSFGIFLKIKPEEGDVPPQAQPLALKIAGVAASLAGWLIALIGLHLTANVSGRLITTIVGLAVSLFGILYLLPTAANKNPIWKS